MTAALQTQRQRRLALVAVISGQVFVHASAAGLRMAVPLMMLREGGILGLSGEMTVGLLVSLFAMLPVLIALPAGRWVDRQGYHKPIAWAVLLCMLGGLLAVPAGLMGQPGWGLSLAASEPLRALLLMLCAACLGCSVNLGMICIQRTAGRLATQADAGADPQLQRAAQNAELKRVFSWLGVAPSVSNMLGPLLAGLFIDAFGFVVAFVLLSVLPLMTLVLARRVPKEALPPSGGAGAAVPSTHAPGRRGWPGIRELLMLPSMRRLLLINWMFSASWDLLSFLVPLQGHALGLSASAIGAVLGAFALSVAVVRLLLPMVSDRLEERRAIMTALCVVALGFGLFPLANGTLSMMTVAVLVGLGLGLVQPMLMTTLHHITPAHRQGESLGLRSVCINLSSAVLPLCFGLLGATLGTAMLFRGMAFLLLAGSRLPLGLRTSQH